VVDCRSDCSCRLLVAVPVPRFVVEQF